MEFPASANTPVVFPGCTVGLVMARYYSCLLFLINWFLMFLHLFAQLKLWDVSRRKVLSTVQAHDGFVRSMTFNEESSSLYTVGDDKLIKQWKTEAVDGSDLKTPVNTILTKSMLTGVSHHRSKPYLATCGEACNLWEQNRAQPIKTFQWGVDSLQCIKFNQVEENVIGKILSA